MPIEDIAGLLTRWRGARTPTEQVRVMTAAARTLRSLSAADRRVLTGALVEGGASEAAARLDASASRVPSTADLTSFAQALRTVEPRQLEAIAVALSDPAERRRLTAAAEADGWQLADATREALPPPPVRVAPSPPTPPPPAGPNTAPTGPAVALPPPAAPDRSEPAPDPAVTAVTDVEEAVTDVEDVTDAEDTPEDEVEVGTGDASWLEAEKVATVADHRSTSGGLPPAGTGPAVTADVTATIATIAAATTPQARLRAVADLEDAAIRTSDLIAVLRALPDGWQRRRAARRLLASLPDGDVDAEQVVTTFARDSDRTAVAAQLVSDGHAHIETVTDHLDARAADRLRRRAASRG